MTIKEDFVYNHPEEWTALISEFQASQFRHSGKGATDEKTGKFLWPSPWIEEMRKDPDFRPVCQEMLIPVMPTFLAPMSDELKRLADFFELPHYEGTASFTPHDETERGVPIDDIPRKTRCSYCGSKMQVKEVLEWKEHSVKTHPMFRRQPPVRGTALLCPGCKRQQML